MKFVYRIIFGLICLLFLSCQNGDVHNINITNNHLPTLGKNSLSDKNNGIVRTIFHFPDVGYTIRFDPINRILYIEGNMIFSLITLPQDWGNMLGAVYARSSYYNDYFYTINANGDLGLVVRDRTTLRVTTRLFQNFLPLHAGETIIDMVSDEGRRVNFLSQYRVFKVVLTQTAGEWIPVYMPEGGNLPALGPNSRLLSIDFEYSNLMFMITYRDPDTREQVRYFYNNSEDDFWHFGADSDTSNPSFAGLRPTRFIDPLLFITWRGYISSGFSQVLVCPITYNIPTFNKEDEMPVCIPASTPTTQNIVDSASNYLSLPSQSESSPVDIAIGEGGDVIKSSDKGKSWDLTARLYDSANVSSLYGIIYNESNGFFEVAGYDKKGKDIILISTDGIFWANPNIPKFSKVFASYNSFCGLVSDSQYPEKSGTTYCWGSNANNQLGLGSNVVTDKAAVPVPLSAPIDESGPLLFSNIVGGNNFFCGNTLVETGLPPKLYCWGDGSLGQLGDGIIQESGYSSPVPIAVKMPSELAQPIKSFVAGSRHNCLLDNSGHPFCWGSNLEDQIDATSLQKIFLSPYIANYNQAYTYSDIAAGEDFTVGYAVSMNPPFSNTQGSTFAWGKKYTITPIQEVLFESGEQDQFGNETNLYAGGDTACLLGTKIGPSGTNVWCFGGNSYGKMGDGTESPSYSKIHNVQAPTSSAITFKTLSISRLSICGITTDNFLYCWGNNDYGQSGIGKVSANLLGPQVPVQLNNKAANFSSVAVGLITVCGVSMEDNNTYCWGVGTSGQLGNRSTLNSVTPVVVNTVMDIESANPISHD